MASGDKIVSVTLTQTGAGYTSAPSITLPIPGAATLSATIADGTDLSTNGSITKIVVGPPGPPTPP